MAISLVPVVRPNVFPDIRPQGTLPQAGADPNAGRTILTGSEGQVIDLNLTFSTSSSKQSAREEKRQYDIARVYQVEDKTGKINKENYVDVEIPHKIRLREGSDKGPTISRSYRQPQEKDYPNKNVEIRERDLIRENKRE